jgi:putative endonuclease
MHYVHVLTSLVEPQRHYVGFTSDLKTRLNRHNSGQNSSTAPFRPWVIAAYFAFPSVTKAQSFERYLKSGSGRTFAKRHFL